MRTIADWLDHPLQRWVGWCLILVFAAVPTLFMLEQSLQRPDLTQLLLFGREFRSRLLPEIRQLEPATDSAYGYDGQFYAQIALDPTFSRPELVQAMDDPRVRGQRIFLPALAHCLGGGQPRRVLQIYASLNLIFWYVLLGWLVSRFKRLSPRIIMCLGAAMLSGGALFSLERSLTDLPATTLGFLSLSCGERAGVAILACALLTKPTSLLFAVRARRRFVGPLAAALTPFLLWQAYLIYAIGAGLTSGGNLGLPLLGWSARIVSAWHLCLAVPWKGLPGETQMFEVLGWISLTAQSIYLLLYPDRRDPIWRVGVTFVALFLCLSPKVYVEIDTVARSVLPLTVAFYLRLARRREGAAFLCLWTLTSAGLWFRLHEILIFLLR